MSITMYNVEFGDCFVINDANSKPLVIDFGIHTNCSKTKKLRYNIIAHELSALEKKDLLLTHYHIDHYSGLIYMKQNCSRFPHPFATIYIPDIFSKSEYSGTIALFILRVMMNRTKLNKTNFLHFVEYLCSTVSKVVLVLQNTQIQGDKYTALWPTSKVIKAREETIKFIADGDINESFFRNMINLSDEIRKLIMDKINRDNQGLDDSEKRKDRRKIFGEILDSLRALREEYNDYFINIDDRRKQLINNYGNHISIVFHNTISGNDNLLFTGDITKDNMIEIEGTTKLHNTYKTIKIPHHGTVNYEFNCTKYNPENILIPNGKVKIKDTDYRISALYSTIATNKICSNSNCSASSCPCTKGHIIGGNISHII